MTRGAVTKSRTRRPSVRARVLPPHLLPHLLPRLVLRHGRLGRRLSSAVRGWQRRLAERKSRPPPPRSPRAAAVDGATVLTEQRVTFPVDQFYLGLRYLRAETPSTGVPKVEALPICCAGCGAALSDTDQVLCTERRWGFRQRTPQPSMYINSLRPGSCKSLGVSRMLLGQGAFDMSDAACAECGKMVGYVFHGAADEHQNGNHVGRAGLVRHPIATPSVAQPLRDVSNQQMLAPGALLHHLRRCAGAS